MTQRHKSCWMSHLFWTQDFKKDYISPENVTRIEDRVRVEMEEIAQTVIVLSCNCNHTTYVTDT